jgi:Flp pilus assembly protein TadD
VDSGSIDFLSLLAYAYLRNGKPAKAVAALEGAEALRPRDPWISRTLAYALLLAQDYNRALSQVERHHRAFGTDNGLDLIRCRALYALGRRDEATRVIEKMSGDLRGTRGDRPS